MPNGRKLPVLAVIAVAAGLSIAHAEPISYADAVTTLSKDCGADIKKLCSGLNLGNNRIADCLHQNAAKVSPTCTSSLASVSASIQQREQAQAAYSKVCAHDIAQRCRGIKGDGYILGCLIKTQKLVTGKCNAAITDAGWR
jgi:sialic acid synthase SpsE